MKTVDDKIDETKSEVTEVVKHLFAAYPSTAFIALNPALKWSNQETWRDHWYFVGFEEQPMYARFEGFRAWVAGPDVTSSDSERGLWFLHINSRGHFYHGIPLQRDQYDFISPRFFCWKKPEPGEDEPLNLVSEEIVMEDETQQVMKNIDDVTQTMLLKPAIEALGGKASIGKVVIKK